MMSRRKTWLSFAALFFAMLPASSTQNSEPFCTPKTPSKDQPPLPKLDMEAFTVEYRASIIDKKYTMRVKEYYDYVHNKVRLDILKNGLRQGVLFDYADNTYILYKYLNQEETEYKCLIQQLDQAKDDNFDIFGFSKGSGSSPIPHVVSSQDILQFAANQQQEYKGETMLDGLNVTHWQSCLSWQDVNATFTLDYYFTHPDFKALGATTPRQVPIRAVVKGVINQGGDTEKNFHHIYEYLNLRAFDRLAPETFSLPDFMVCQGESTRWTHDFPSLPDSMSYTLEKVSVESGGDRSPMGEIKVTRVFEDAKRKLVRIDHAGITSISDFSTGVEYIIQPNSCSTRPINPDNVISASEEGGLIKIKDRPEINYLKREFRFTGPKLFREISALAFAGTKPESDEVLEAYVAVNDRRPLGIVVKNSSSGSKTYYNIFKFKKTAYPIHDNQDPFDIRRCADSNKITDFDITLKYDSNYKGNIENWNEAIIYALRDYISEVAGCSVLQISIRDQHITAFGQELQWSGFFLDATPNVKRAKVETNCQSNRTMNLFMCCLKQSGTENLLRKCRLMNTETTISLI
ncbi:hypothetical protein EGW08_002215 [Elysia chlorotica]|uniref:LolA-like domain-containing protein n=1 Tax=Elysia chlorotica TaxID=188477 RepID=A0A3S1BRV0_ELYCH|nr:hypothetical protein EGW08_002215 [Elysia chlorotica]